MDEPTGHGYTYHCPYCDERGMWRIERWGDAVVSWSCAEHLSAVCEWLQRDFEVTRLDVRLAEKSTEWAEIGESLRRVAEGPRA